MYKIITILLFFTVFNVQSQDDKAYLLTDMNIQIESTDAVNHLYNFKFSRAIHGFNFLKYRYPQHPMPYFLIGFTYWWKMQPDVGKITKYDDIFISYMDSTIEFAEELYDKDEDNIDAIFFLSAAHGFLARIHGERGNYARATNHGRKSVSYMEEGEEFTELSSEFLFGLGLYNYYEPWLKENYSYLRPILFFFGNGDTEKGVEQLIEVSKTAFFTRTEAQYFLIDILNDVGRKEEALDVVTYLNETYPDNPVFQKEYIRLCYGMYTRRKDVEKICLSILDQYEKGTEGYNEHIGRQASYFLGFIYQHYIKDEEKSKQYYAMNVDMTEKINNLESNYYHHALFELGMIDDRAKNYDTAAVYFEKVKKLTHRKKGINKKAKDKLKEYKKMK